MHDTNPGPWADLSHIKSEALVLAERLYLWMLTRLAIGQNPVINQLRFEADGELAALRDFITQARGNNGEDVQDEFEARARAIIESRKP